MSAETLTYLRDYLYNTLSPSNMLWLGTQLTEHAQLEELSRKPYTMEELNARIERSERESAAGLGQTTEEMFCELEAEFAQEDKLEMAV